jgi:hypothetical protein
MLPQLLSLFVAQMQDTDSFLYLTAIDGLVALAEVNAKDVIPVLMRQYR